MLEFYYSNTNKKRKREPKNQQINLGKLNLGKLPFHPEGTQT